MKLQYLLMSLSRQLFHDKVTTFLLEQPAILFRGNWWQAIISMAY